ncbi:glycosyl hydrolase [Opitutaceae bacterium EW11]|nr:glycosyl hydrolase [Opitutaceae bacterium EW11]
MIRLRALTLAFPLLVLSAGLLRAETARFEFGSWAPGTSPQEVGKRIAERFLATPRLDWGAKSRFIVYPEVCAWYGALTYAKLAGDTDLSKRLVERFEPIFLPENAWMVPPITHVDNCVFGAVPLEIYQQTGQYRYRQLGLTLADGQWDNPTPEGLTRQTRFWIDDMFMITAVQVQAYRATGDTRYLDRAAKEMVVYLEKLQRPNGLFFHAPDVPFFWGRGNGWMAAGMSELLRSLPEGHPQRSAILAGYRKMMATLLATQAEDGMWRQLVDKPESWPETSCTGMFAFAFITGVKNGWLDGATYGPAARKAWLQLITYIDANSDVREVCVGTNKRNDYQFYLDRPRKTGDLHGQAPVLWCASALLRP